MPLGPVTEWDLSALRDVYAEPGLQPENVAVDALINWLLLNLPARVATINATRAAVLRAPLAGPYNIPVGGLLRVSFSGTDSGSLPCPLTSGGAVPAATLAADVNSATATTAADVDDAGRLRLTCPTPPAAPGTNSVVALLHDDNGAGAETGAHAALGWNPGGEKVVRTPIVAPGPSAVFDGWPEVLSPGAGQKAFRLVLEAATATPLYGDKQIRRDEYSIAVALVVLDPREPNESYRSKEHVRSCLRAVRGLVISLPGRQLGRGNAGYGDVMKVLEVSAKVGGIPAKLKPDPNVYDVASLELRINVFGRPPVS